MANIFIRRGVFYCRVHVPIALRATLNGRAQLWKSLRTRSRVVADIQATQWEGRVVRLFPYLLKFAPSMTSEQIQWLVVEYVNATLETVEEFTTTDCTQAGRLIEGLTAEYLIADKGYDSDAIVEQAKMRVWQRSSRPEKTGQQKGSMMKTCTTCVT